MKTIRISLFVALCLFIGTQSFANTIDENTRTLRKEVARMIDAPDMESYGVSETYVFVNFTISENNEIVVLEVVADNEDLSQFVFQSLNNRKLKASTEDMQAGTEYNLKIAFRAEA
ncbi:MAG: hypothetical protein MI974_21620 [Chitinophagales bacterium]|nr:hypothetical protein [Chitinophagales bacterium]